MATVDEFRHKIERITQKARIVAERYALILEQRNQAMERISMLEGEITRRDREISNLQRQVEFLQVATVMAPDRAEVKRTRALLAELVREIDKSIAELNA